ncbi:hypothetical protein LPB140_01410 [Sphingorhabdus lutea]|uniref:Rod shape-determining protein MreD n=1 Tax=Sphingorhabdus lutea TaxID=1913578 RepID=A0A1L3JE95_9SPHN|nr:hypothetical protein LPB140_01410 [Sphingorhabdus lutea]
MPIASILFCSALSGIFLITQHPLLPPLGFMMFISWRLLRPSLFPMWAGLPFGLMDDIFTAQPFGSGGLLFSLTMLVMMNIDNRTSWRQYGMNWVIGAILIIIYLFANLFFQGIYQIRAEFITIMPQTILAILTFPLMLRLAGWLNRYRLSS